MGVGVAVVISHFNHSFHKPLPLHTCFITLKQMQGPPGAKSAHSLWSSKHTRSEVCLGGFSNSVLIVQSQINQECYFISNHDWGLIVFQLLTIYYSFERVYFKMVLSNKGRAFSLHRRSFNTCYSRSYP